MKRLYLVDVSSMFFRAFYAIRPLSTPAGMPTNAIYGFVAMTVKLLREIRPDYMAFCFDRPEPSFRKALDPRYKANRVEMPEDLVPQVPYIRKVSEAMGVPCFDKEGYEADDVIGTFVAWGRERDLEVVIVSGDKDFGQLVRPHVTLYDTMKDIRYDQAGVVEKWGVEPRKMRDYLALVGDSSDNIAGVRGIGPKGACKLLAEFESVEDIYARLDQVSSPTIRRKLEEGRDEAFLSKKLVTIVEDIDLDIPLEALRLKPIERETLHALLMELDFKSFAKTLLGDVGTASGSTQPLKSSTTTTVPVAEPMSPSSATPASGIGSSFVRPVSDEMGARVAASLAGEVASSDKRPSSAAELEGRLETVGTSVRVDDFRPGLVELPRIEETRLTLAQIDRWLAPGTETWGFHTERGVLLAQGTVVAEVEGSWDELGQLLSAKKLRWKGFDLKEFWKTVNLRWPVEVTGTGSALVWDQMLAAYVARAGSIDDVRALFTLYNGVSLPELPSPAQLFGAHLSLERNLRRKVESVGGEKVLHEIELPLAPILYEMERNGVLIDGKALEAQGAELAKEISTCEKSIHHEAGEIFNVGSPKQLGHILFEKLKMPAGKRTKTGYSTDEDTLAKLAPEYPICAKVLQYRELSKLKSTYVDALPILVNRSTGRVHTTFNQASTTTGRLSSTNPNLQNIPIRTERGARVRKAFIADEGNCLVSADYSQIELRVLAHITGDSGLTKAFMSGVDIHTATAAEVFGVATADVTPEQRRKAKAVNFGLAYGQGAFGLAEALRISRSEATEIIGRYFNRFSGVKTFMEDTVETAKQKGYVETIFGRRRYLDELFSKSPMVRKFGERAAINAPIQGTAADIVKKAMVTARGAVAGKMLLQVHDELIFEGPQDKAQELAAQAKGAMEGAVKLNVPLEVNVGIGRDWDSAHS